MIKTLATALALTSAIAHAGEMTYHGTPGAIPDQPCFPVGCDAPDFDARYSDTITVPDDYVVTTLLFGIDYTHSLPSDIVEMTLSGPDGTSRGVWPLENTHDLTPFFAGISSLGDWTLEILDGWTWDSGYVNDWWITVGYDDVTPSAIPAPPLAALILLGVAAAMRSRAPSVPRT